MNKMERNNFYFLTVIALLVICVVAVAYFGINMWAKLNRIEVKLNKIEANIIETEHYLDHRIDRVLEKLYQLEQECGEIKR